MPCNRGGGSRVSSVPNYHISLQDDHPWNGTTGLNFNGTFSMEDVAGSAVMRAAGLPVQNVVPVQVRVNNVNRATSGATTGSSQQNTTTQQQDSSKIPGAPGGKSGPPAKSGSDMPK